MEIDNRFQEWFKNQDSLGKTDSIKKFAIRLHSLKKTMDRATKAEFEYGFNRVGIRGGKFTALNAKACNCTRMYLQCENELKWMMRTL